MHSMLGDKEDKGEAINKYKRGKEMETVITRPTYTGTVFIVMCLLQWDLTSWLVFVGINVLRFM